MTSHKFISDNIEYTITFLSNDFLDIRRKDFIGSFGVVFEIKDNKLATSSSFASWNEIPQSIIDYTNKLLKLRTFI